jgi:hypothetical protein
MKRIQKARIKFLSLCPRGKNKMQAFYKDDGTVVFDTLTKATEDAGELTALVYVPEHADRDSHVADYAVIKDMAYHFQKEGGQIDIRHNEKAVTRDQAYVAESFIVQKGDPRFVDYNDNDGNPVDTAGAWATVLKIDDPELRQLYKSGEWGGISMAGEGLMTVEKSDDDEPSWLSKLLKAIGLKNLPTTNITEVIDMEKQELLDVLKAQTEAIVKAITPETKEEVKKEDTVDLSDPKALRELADKLAKEEVIKNLDLSDPKAVRAYADSLDKADDSDEGDSSEDLEKNDDDADAKEIDELRAKLRKAEIKAAQSKSPLGKDDDVEPLEGFTKEDMDALQIGERMAQFNNKQRGFKADV